YLLLLSIGYVRGGVAEKRSVNKLSGAQTVFTQLLHQRSAPHAERARGLGHGAVRLFQRLSNESDFDRRQVVLQIDAAARQLDTGQFRGVGECRRPATNI